MFKFRLTKNYNRSLICRLRTESVDEIVCVKAAGKRKQLRKCRLGLSALANDIDWRVMERLGLTNGGGVNSELHLSNQIDVWHSARYIQGGYWRHGVQIQ